MCLADFLVLPCITLSLTELLVRYSRIEQRVRFPWFQLCFGVQSVVFVRPFMSRLLHRFLVFFLFVALCIP